jgi:integrase
VRYLRGRRRVDESNALTRLALDVGRSAARRRGHEEKCVDLAQRCNQRRGIVDVDTYELDTSVGQFTRPLRSLRYPRRQPLAPRSGFVGGRASPSSGSSTTSSARMADSSQMAADYFRLGPRFHDLRHSHVAYLIAAGWDFCMIQLRLAHASIKTTFDTYGHLLPHGETDRLEASPNGCLPPPVCANLPAVDGSLTTTTMPLLVALSTATSVRLL